MKTALITGGTQGIGYELAKCFAKDGYHLVLVSRNKQKLLDVQQYLEQNYPCKVETIAMDLSKVSSAFGLYEITQQKQLRIDILVNNAGCGYVGKTVDVDVADEEAMVVLNDITLLSLTKLFLKEMLERNEGEIINIASTSAFQPGPYMSGYYASKAFVLSYTRAIAEEVKKTAVKVYCYCPGPVDTEFYEKAGSSKTIGAISAAKAAQYLYSHRHKHVVIMTGFNRLLQWFPTSLKMKWISYIKTK